jgi:hypothetical protein
VVELECGGEVYLGATAENEAVLGMTMLGLLM